MLFNRPVSGRRFRSNTARSGSAVIVLAFALILVMSATALADSEEPWEFQGGGWGHGVGLSQFGAMGMANEGSNAGAILQHYYTGTELGTMPADHWTTEEDGLWVGLESGVSKVTFGVVGAGVVTICQPSDCSDPERQIDLTTEDDWFFELVPDPSNPGATACRIRRGQGTEGENWGAGPCDAEVTQPGTTNTRIVVSGQEYAHGTLRLTGRGSNTAIHAVLALSMEKYLYGLSEVPSSWPSEALKAQAIIGRSYALATAEERRESSFWYDLCACHIRDTSSDQVYAGWSKEDPLNSGNRWKEAVDSTNPEILTHPQSQYPFGVAKAFYSSSNGGASENNEDVWGGTPLPWLRSVPDRWSADPQINPLASWKVSVSDEDMAAHFGWDRALDAFVLAGPPGVLVRFTGKVNGKDVNKTLNGTQIASLLKLQGFGYQAVGSAGTSVRVSPYITAVIDPPGFDDIVGHLFEADIEWALEKGITRGCNPPSNTLYCPDDEVSREVMAAFLNRYLDLGPASKDHFSDDNGSVFEDDINRLAEAGITKGCGGTRFCPKLTVDRGQMAAFLVRAFRLSDDGGGDLFRDDNRSIFEHDIDLLGTAGITKGCNPPTNDRFCPNLAVDRGAMAAFLHRAPAP